MTDRTKAPGIDSAEIVGRLRLGDHATTDEVRRRVRRIVAFRGYGIPAEDQRDIEQRTMTELWQAVTRSGFEPTGLWGFVEVVTSRRCIDWRRSCRPEIDLESVREPADPGMGPLGSVLEREKLRRAEAVLAALPPSCRELIRLHAGEGRTYREIAKILGVSETALRVRMHRCIKRAQSMFNEPADTGPATAIPPQLKK